MPCTRTASSPSWAVLQGAYNIDPVEFSALQDAYAYNSYYAVTEAWLKSGLGIDISGRADCVKGMVWSITNMCGTGGCRDFFRWANLSNSMTDREFVTALSNSVVNNVATKYSSQPQYHEGWKNRYRNELKDCLVYIAEDEAAAATPVQPEPTPAPSPTPDSNDDSSDDANDDRMDAPSTGADGDGSAGGTTNNGSTSNGSAAGDSSSSSVGNTGGDASGSTGADASNSSTGSSDSSADTGSNNGSGSAAIPDSDVSKDDSNKAPDAPVASPDKKPSFSVQLGSTLGSSLMAGVNNGSTQNRDNSDQVSTEKSEADKGSSSDEKGDKSAQEKDGGKKSESEAKDENKDKTEDGKQQGEDSGKGSTDNQVQEQNDSKTVTTTTTTTTTTKSSGGNMPKTGDLIVMASLASASLATLGATSIVSGKHKLDQQKKASGEDGSEE